MRNYDRALSVISNMSKVKMTMNDHKGSIERCTPTEIIDFAKVELEELHEAMEDQDQMHIIEEAADVLNFLIAAVEQSMNQYKNRKKKNSYVFMALGEKADGDLPFPLAGGRPTGEKSND